MSASSANSMLGWLLVLCIGVGASAWQLMEPPGAHGGHHDAHGHAAGSGPQPMFSWQPHEARRIELRAPDRSVDMVLTDAGWQGAPAGFDAEAFVTMFARARADRRFEPSPDDDYGLEPGIMTVLVKDAGQRVLAGLIVGDSLPDGIGRYVRGMADSDITVIPDYQIRPLLQAAGAPDAGRHPADMQQAGHAMADGHAMAVQQAAPQAGASQTQAGPETTRSITPEGSASMAENHVN